MYKKPPKMIAKPEKMWQLSV